MATRADRNLDSAILTALHGRADSGQDWVRHVAVKAAARIGRSSADAERSLRRLHDRGCLALAFGLERGNLADLGLALVRRVGRRPLGYAVTIEPPLRVRGPRA